MCLARPGRPQGARLSERSARRCCRKTSGRPKNAASLQARDCRRPLMGFPRTPFNGAGPAGVHWPTGGAGNCPEEGHTVTLAHTHTCTLTYARQDLPAKSCMEGAQSGGVGANNRACKRRNTQPAPSDLGRRGAIKHRLLLVACNLQPPSCPQYSAELLSIDWRALQAPHSPFAAVRLPGAEGAWRGAHQATK